MCAPTGYNYIHKKSYISFGGIIVAVVVVWHRSPFSDHRHSTGSSFFGLSSYSFSKSSKFLLLLLLLLLHLYTTYTLLLCARGGLKMYISMIDSLVSDTIFSPNPTEKSVRIGCFRLAMRITRCAVVRFFLCLSLFFLCYFILLCLVLRFRRILFPPPFSFSCFFFLYLFSSFSPPNFCFTFKKGPLDDEK